MTYDISIKKVAVAGASGPVGTAILKELLKSQLFEITVLTRQASHHTFPPGVKVCPIDYTSTDSLIAALSGQDALVSSVSMAAVPSQRLLIDAAVKAGVKRIIPSEFGCDLKNTNTRKLPVFAGKVDIERYLDELAIKGETSYTLVFCGPFLDLGLRQGIFLNFEQRKANIYDGGEQLISTSRLGTAGKAVRRILTHPRETADRAVWVKDIDISQNQLLKLAQSLTPGEEWEVTHVSTAELEKESMEEIKRKEVGVKPMQGLLLRGIFAPECGNLFQHVHNSVLGITGISGPDLEELVASIFGTKKLE
ncbi:NAD(P)-binding protein [Mollisia scopiformis]|uniref:NAD(P)-binding protein n=1 Tax=Mollisia scopiformis TaxID=149040 RepID=A0A194XQZ6_MOLSC|nr:NAD(P)-binding protein [Mollisia scopiformis]KUJ22608.1 NAD(P)-binding protein [Mollisia scopiformis]